MKIMISHTDYVQFAKSASPNKIILTISKVKDKTTITTSVELTTEQFNELIKI